MDGVMMLLILLTATNIYVQYRELKRVERLEKRLREEKKKGISKTP